MQLYHKCSPSLQLTSCDWSWFCSPSRASRSGLNISSTCVYTRAPSLLYSLLPARSEVCATPDPSLAAMETTTVDVGMLRFLSRGWGRLVWWSSEMSQTESVGSIVLAGIVGGFLVAGGHALLEHVWFYFLSWLDGRGLIRRLAPSIPVTMLNYRKESFWAVAIGPMPIAAGVWLARKGYLDPPEKWRFKVSVEEAVSAWLFTWSVMFLHDLYFYTVHSLMHRFKAVYRNFHAWHHSTKGDITVFSTAYGDLLDIALTFSPFYAAVMLWLYRVPSFNLLHLICLAWAVNGVNLMGHCGYHLPAWVYVPGSLGVLLTPYAQRPKHHYIHHLDPRYNRSLYFTWWDMLAGTYKDKHPKIQVYS